MHDAPSVNYPVGRSRWAAALGAAAWLGGAAVTLLWSAQPQVAAWRLAIAWTAVAAAALLSWRAWRAAPGGVLAWDGAAWTWARHGAGGVSGDVRVALDLQRLLLVRWDGADGRLWLWLERASGRERWDELRRAVYSRARPAALPAGEPPAAKP